MMAFLKAVSVFCLFSLVYGGDSSCYQTKREATGLEYAPFERCLKAGDTITVYGRPNPAFERATAQCSTVLP
ncbi:unnamed protein product [Caenorhabditis auriculariae]|uniref:Uncharacterized protein n=1 Tax=Caenorhabditis auriculariae TaxID=2777116 RepID=A0A8S1GUK1_9PELO|nr:unnamed protein product [Caenorhabditis auriculariae]